MTVSNRSVPSASVIPVLAYPDVGEATVWLREAFGFRVRLRIGAHRAQLTHADGAVIVTQGAGRRARFTCASTTRTPTALVPRAAVR
jgi:hypothetical protein